jgi:hypothetical protein
MTSWQNMPQRDRPGPILLQGDRLAMGNYGNYGIAIIATASARPSADIGRQWS